MAMPAVVVITERKRNCACSSGAKGLQEALQFLSLGLPYFPLPLALPLRQALAVPVPSQKARPIDTKC